jgi:hypothetical protein
MQSLWDCPECPNSKGALLLAASNTVAMSGTSQLVWRDKPVPAHYDRPEETLELANDSLRTEGRNPWFSECPSDVNFYAFPKSVKPAPEQLAPPQNENPHRL